MGARSEYEPTEDGEEDLVIIELDRGDGFSGELIKAEMRDCRSRGCIGWERASALTEPFAAAHCHVHIFIVPSPFGTALLYKIHSFTHGKAPGIPPKVPCPGPPNARLQTVSSGLSLPALVAHSSTANALLVAPGAPHETETRLIDGRLLRVYKNQWPSLRVFWLWALSQHKEAVYLVYENQSYTFGQVHNRAVKAASVLRHVYGVQKGSHQLLI